MALRASSSTLSLTCPAAVLGMWGPLDSIARGEVARG